MTDGVRTSAFEESLEVEDIAKEKGQGLSVFPIELTHPNDWINFDSEWNWEKWRKRNAV